MIISAGISERYADIKRPIIIGAGPVGLALARMLELANCPSLLIEAGAYIPDNNVSKDLEPEFIGSDLRGAIIGRTRQIGGGLNLWGGQLAMVANQEASSPASMDPWPINIEELQAQARLASGLLGEPIELCPKTPPTINEQRASLADAGLDLVATAWMRSQSFLLNFGVKSVNLNLSL